MPDNDYLYVKKKHFYSAMMTVLLLFLYVISEISNGDRNIHIFWLIMGYFFYFSFLQIKLRYDKLRREGDKIKDDSKSQVGFCR